MKTTEEIIKAFKKTIYGEDDALFDRQGNNVSTQVEVFLTQTITDIQREMIEKCHELIIERSSKTPSHYPSVEPTKDQLHLIGYVAGITDVINSLQSPAKEEEQG